MKGLYSTLWYTSVITGKRMLGSYGVSVMPLHWGQAQRSRRQGHLHTRHKLGELLSGASTFEHQQPPASPHPSLPLSGKLSTHKTVMARSWPWLDLPSSWRKHVVIPEKACSHCRQAPQEESPTPAETSALPHARGFRVEGLGLRFRIVGSGFGV